MRPEIAVIIIFTATPTAMSKSANQSVGNSHLACDIFFSWREEVELNSDSLILRALTYFRAARLAAFDCAAVQRVPVLAPDSK
jgi:hypothetical protein